MGDNINFNLRFHNMLEPLQNNYAASKYHFCPSPYQDKSVQIRIKALL